MVQMNYIEKEHRPRSDDPDYWDVWTGNKDRGVNWEEIARDWQNTSQALVEINDEQEPDELSVEEKAAEGSDYGDYLCHVRRDEFAADRADDDDMPFLGETN
jgi:hypothetical protein